MPVWLKVVLLSVCLAGAAQARNLALIVGNDSYSAVPALHKARADARGYGAFFAARGFEVHLHEDLDQRDMVVALADFLDLIRPGDTVVFAFSGHGWSNGRENFLVPTDIRINGSQTLIEKESFVLKNGFNGVLDEIARRAPALTVAIIDACRDNPFAGAGNTRAIGLSRGLVPVQAAEGTFIAFSAGEGQAALDRLSDQDGAQYSVFTRNFLDELDKPQDLQAAFKAAQQRVNELARSVGHAQRPAYYDEVIGSACLTGNCGVLATPVAPTPGNAALEWQDFRTSNSIPALELFARRFPGTAYAALAQERIAALQAARDAPAPEAAPAPPAPQPQPQPAPSADFTRPGWCGAATTATERAICASMLLSAQDITMSRLYFRARGRLSGEALARFKRTQSAWLARRNGCGRDAACLEAAYDARIGQLR